MVETEIAPDGFPLLPPGTTDYGLWRVQWETPYEEIETSLHIYKVGSVSSDNLLIPGECRWLLNLDGHDSDTISLDLDYVDGMSDQEIVALIRKGAVAAKLDLAMWHVRNVVDDFTGSCNELWTIEEFQARYEREYALLYRHQDKPEVKELLDRFEPFWRGDVKDAGYVYCLSDQQGHYKLGRTKQLQPRIKKLGTQPPFKIKLLFTHYVFNAHLYEKLLHRTFTHKRMNEEWFGLDEDDLESIKSGQWAEIYKQA